jgi:hypothetical protein
MLCMQQQNTQFIEVLNKLKKNHQTQQDIDTINKLCLRFPPFILEFLHLLYTNKVHIHNGPMINLISIIDIV